MLAAVLKVNKIQTQHKNILKIGRQIYKVFMHFFLEKKNRKYSVELWEQKCDIPDACYAKSGLPRYSYFCQVKHKVVEYGKTIIQ